MKLKEMVDFNGELHIKYYWITYNNKAEFDKVLHYLDKNGYSSEKINYYAPERGDSFKNSYPYQEYKETAVCLSRKFAKIQYIECIKDNAMIIHVSEIDELENVSMTVEDLYEEMKLLDIRNKREIRDAERAQINKEYNDRNNYLTDLYYHCNGSSSKFKNILIENGCTYKRVNELYADTLDLRGDRKMADYVRYGDIPG